MYQLGIVLFLIGGGLLVSEPMGKFTWRSKLGVACFYGGIIVAVFLGPLFDTKVR